MSLLWVITSLLASQAFALFEDQALKFDWRQQYIGPVEDLSVLATSKVKEVAIVRTASNVLAALDGDNGRLLWRQVLADQEKLLHFQFDGKLVTALSYDLSENSSFTRTWNAQNGALSSEIRVEAKTAELPIHDGFLFDEKPHLLHRTDQNGLKIFVIHDEDKTVTHSFSTGAGQDKAGFSCEALTDTFICVSSLLSTVYTTKLPLSGNSMIASPLASAGLTEKPRAGAKIGLLSHGRVQLPLESGALAVISLKAGHISSVNTIKPKKSGSFANVASCGHNDDLIMLEQACNGASESCGSSSITITKGASQHVYEVLSDRGYIAKSWAFCDPNEEEAFQLMIRSQDGSLASVTPLGNVMWIRDEGLAAIKAMSLVSKPSSDDDGTYESESETAENVSAMFLKRIKHHAAQVYMLLEKIKLGKIGLGALLMGNPDASYDDFGIRKVIVAFTKTGGLYGLDSKSGKVLWQKMTICHVDGSDSPVYLLQQRSSTHFSFDPIAALICEASPSETLLIKFNPLNGKTSDGSRRIGGKVQRAILLHQAHHEDHIRPILIVTEGHNYEIEPKHAAKSLADLSGKIFVASIDADKQGIHGHRITVNPDNTLNVVPVWSFSSAGTDILYLSPKPTEEVVHSQGRVMADRSVLFKYLNPNLAFVLAEGVESSGKNFINIYLLDLVNGRIVFSAHHKRVQKPYHVVHSENWAVYSYYNEKSRRAELGSLELFEGKTQSNASVFSSFLDNVSPLVERQSYILGQSHVAALKDTTTEKGITTKHILMATSSGSIYDIPRGFLDPRRPNINTPPEMREPGLPPYIPELVFPPEVILNYNQTVSGARGIVTAPTGLESTSVVVVYGLDIYCTRVTPSKGFDLLKDDFDHYVIASVLVGLTAAAYVTRRLSQRKMLKSAWK